MTKSAYPKGVECHGGYLRVWFIYEGKRKRESLSIPDTPKNRKAAGELRQAVVYAIRTGTFNYCESFPNSQKAVREKIRREITVSELFSRWLELKSADISDNTMYRYEKKLKTCAIILGENINVSYLAPEDLTALRNELLNGTQFIAANHKTVINGRSAVTVNTYMSSVLSVFRFAHENGYTETLLTSSVKMLKKSKPRPDPLTEDEFSRLICACSAEQNKNLWTIAVYTGLRHGELCALAWEDIDMVKGTLTVRRSTTTVKQMTVPKTDAGTDRVIQLISPAIEALKKQALLTRMNRQHEIKVGLREKRKFRTDLCTFVFNPQIASRNGMGGIHYHAESLRSIWNSAIRISGIRHRKAYQSRHTFACWLLSKGANPAFIASQMGHTSSQMVHQVYGDWMPDNNEDQIAMLNRKMSQNAPLMPHAKEA